MTTAHNNNFDFKIEGLTEVTFIETDHSITQKQPYNGITCNGTRLTIKAGRKGSKEVANWFEDKVSGGGGIAVTYADNMPSKLNFAASGTLTLKISGVTYTAKNVMIAQGHVFGSNNWWIGSAQMEKVEHSKTTQIYAKAAAEAALSYTWDIITENPTGALMTTANLITKIVPKHKVGSGLIAFETDLSASTVELLLLQMKNSNVDLTLTGTYSHPESALAQSA